MDHCLIIFLRQSSKDLTLISVFEKSLVHLLCSIAEININTPYKVLPFLATNEWFHKKKTRMTCTVRLVQRYLLYN